MTAEPISLVVGLGNPGNQYDRTRHNAGFWLVDRWADKLNAKFVAEKSFFGEVAKARWQGRQIVLLKPTTFMNRSGQSVGALARFYKIPLSSILVAHDELDLLPGQVRLKSGGGHAGHNGLRDIQSVMGGPGFWRLRIGIGHPRSLGLMQAVADFVLHPPSLVDQDAIDRALDRCDQAMPLLLESNMSRAMAQLHRDDEPPTKSA
ncbi:aminoacyl-tRNA hydrolase [Orrella daihaiensis]|uniref:Peptidyl-tRNA hydrolase n=1 Tax=Orrella daihaiensis TaxID=2782176 RepID=A0ABY4AL56_9BURK|nr:aminoacyl-tRNA hydrolase [Orrella daihaiensis]UOD50783.1 aminoacyl-tRNA hydrolase [Orrella daihaiensis]